MDHVRQFLLQIAYMLTSNRWRVALVTILVDVALLAGWTDFDQAAATRLAEIIALVGSFMIAALSWRDPTSKGGGSAAVVLFVWLALVGGCQ